MLDSSSNSTLTPSSPPVRVRWNTLAWILLGVVFSGLSLYLLFNPTPTGGLRAYRLAASHWWISESMYPGGGRGFLYAPTFAVFFTPLHLISPPILGEILWRALGFGLFSWGLWKLSSLIGSAGAEQSELDSDVYPRRPTENSIAFLLLVLLAVPASLAALKNGQTNLPLSATFVLSALALRNQKWGIAAGLLSLALVLKPLALAPWLLAFAVFSAMRIPLLVGLLILAAMGFLHTNPSYAWSQWVEYIDKLFVAYTPDTQRVSDLFGILKKAGVATPVRLDPIIRTAASVGALAFVWSKYRRGGAVNGSWSLWVAVSLIFTLFNPRAETNSYVLISPLVAFVAVGHLLNPKSNKLAGWILVLASLGLVCDGMGKTIYLATDVWFKPLIVLTVSPLLFKIPDRWKTTGDCR